MFADAVFDQNQYFTEVLTESSSLAISHLVPVKKSQHPSTSGLLYLENDFVPIEN